MKNNKAKNVAIAVVAIIVLILIAIFACKWIGNVTKETYSYELIDGIDGLSYEIDKQTKEFKQRAEEAQKKYEDSIKYSD